MAVFLEGSAPALPRNPVHQEMRPPEIFADFSRRKTEHHTSHLALRTVFLMFTSLMPNDFGAKPLHLLGAIIVTECESDNGGEGDGSFGNQRRDTDEDETVPQVAGL